MTIKLDRHIEGLEDQYFSNPTAEIQRALDVAHAHYWRTNVVPYDVVQMLWFEELEAIQEQKALAHRELDLPSWVNWPEAPHEEEEDETDLNPYHRYDGPDCCKQQSPQAAEWGEDEDLPF